MRRGSLALVCVLAGLAAAGARGQNPPAAAVAKEPTSYREVVKKVLPAVVSLETRTKPRARVNPPPPFDGPPPEGGPPKDDFGSGFLVAPGNVVVTSFHIVQDAEQVIVRLHDGRKFTSRDIRGDNRSDLAVILLNTKGAVLPTLELGDSDAMEIGDRVLAVGAPFGLTGSVTHGIVSGKGRDLNLNLYDDFVQTDAAINPGNSGGPLVNLDGKVVGINAAIKSRSGGFQGVGLAVSSNLARGVIEALRTEGVVRRAFLGVQARELEAGVGPRLGLPKGAVGVVVGHVYPDTPAAKAGLRPGDVLTRVGDKAVPDVKTLQILVARLPAGKPVAVEYYRDGKAQTADVPLVELPPNLTTGVPAPRPLPAGLPAVAVAKLGLELADLRPGLAQNLGYPAGTTGVLITRVQPTGAAADAGLQGGMLITRIEGKAVATAAEAQKALEATPPEGGLLLQFQSVTGGVTYTLLSAP